MIRKDFNHKSEHFEQFRGVYLYELNHNPQAMQFLDLIRDKLKIGNVTLMYDGILNNLAILEADSTKTSAPFTRMSSPKPKIT